MRFLVPLSLLLLAAPPAIASDECSELPRSGSLLVGKANGETFVAGPETPAGLCAVFPGSDTNPRFLAKGDYRLLPGTRVVDWPGAWIQGNHAGITIVAGDTALSVDGEATHGPSRDAPAVGGFTLTLPLPEEWTDELAFAVIDDLASSPESAEPFDCVIRMRRAGFWLVVNDNGRCGGAGLSFGGIYERRSGR